jgi:flagellin
MKIASHPLSIFILKKREALMSISSTTNLGALASGYYFGLNTEMAAKATEKLASGSRVYDPSEDPSSAAIGFDLQSTIGVLHQASRNSLQASSMLQLATSVLGSSNDVLSRMSVLTAQANSGTVGTAELQMINDEYQQLLMQLDNNAIINSRWAGVSILGGGPGSIINSGAQVLAANPTQVAPANTIINTINTSLTGGLISGVASSVHVTQAGFMGAASNIYDISLQVGNQTFTGSTTPLAGVPITLQSLTDPGNVIVLNYSSSVAGIVDATTFQNSLSTVFGLSVGVNTSFTSYSAGNIPGTMTVSPGAGTSPGLYALSYYYDAPNTTGTFKISYGSNYWTVTENSPAASITNNIFFSNGMSIALNAFNGQANLAQTTFTVSGGGSQNYQFQVGEKSSDVVAISFTGATAAALGIAGTNVLSVQSAGLAESMLNGAMDTINNYIAQVAGVNAQLDMIQNSLVISIQNQTAAMSTFVDADVAGSMMDLQSYKGLKQISGTVFAQSLQDASQIAQLIQQTF